MVKLYQKLSPNEELKTPELCFAHRGEKFKCNGTGCDRTDQDMTGHVIFPQGPPDTLVVNLNRLNDQRTSVLKFLPFNLHVSSFYLPRFSASTQTHEYYFVAALLYGAYHYTCLARHPSGQYFYHDKENVYLFEGDFAQISHMSVVGLWFRAVRATRHANGNLGRVTGCRQHENNCYMNAFLTCMAYEQLWKN
jgi:hypothetical protein